MLGALFILDDPIFNGLAISLIFGILVSTVLTLVVIPVFYYVTVRARCRHRLDPFFSPFRPVPGGNMPRNDGPARSIGAAGIPGGVLLESAAVRLCPGTQPRRGARSAGAAW
jgi:hypothetical protein